MTDGIDFYFPIDAQTKAFAIVVDGNATVSLVQTFWANINHSVHVANHR